MEPSDVNCTTKAGNSVTKDSRVRVEDRVSLGVTWSWKWETEGKKEEDRCVSVLTPQGLTEPGITSFSERQGLPLGNILQLFPAGFYIHINKMHPF